MARKSNFSEKQIIDAIHEVEAGATQADVARKMGVSTHMLMRWRSKYGGMTVSEYASAGPYAPSPCVMSDLLASALERQCGEIDVELGTEGGKRGSLDRVGGARGARGMALERRDHGGVRETARHRSATDRLVARSTRRTRSRTRAGDGYMFAIRRSGEATTSLTQRESGRGCEDSTALDYFFAPDVISEICRELDVPFRISGYR